MGQPMKNGSAGAPSMSTSRLFRSHSSGRFSIQTEIAAWRARFGDTGSKEYACVTRRTAVAGGGRWVVGGGEDLFRQAVHMYWVSTPSRLRSWKLFSRVKARMSSAERT